MWNLSSVGVRSLYDCMSLFKGSYSPRLVRLLIETNVLIIGNLGTLRGTFEPIGASVIICKGIYCVCSAPTALGSRGNHSSYSGTYVGWIVIIIHSLASKFLCHSPRSRLVSTKFSLRHFRYRLPISPPDVRHFSTLSMDAIPYTTCHLVSVIANLPSSILIP